MSPGSCYKVKSCRFGGGGTCRDTVRTHFDIYKENETREGKEFP